MEFAIKFKIQDFFSGYFSKSAKERYSQALKKIREVSYEEQDYFGKINQIMLNARLPQRQYKKLWNKVYLNES